MVYTLIIFLSVLVAIEVYIRLFGNYCEPWFDTKENIVKRKRNTQGVYKTEFTSTGYFRINNEGWNSHRDYYRSQESGERDQETKKFRIAIVGHSNIEGLRVPVDRTLSKILEDDLKKNGIATEVYTFGYGGMNLAQAMHVSRYAIDNFRPDILIIGTMLENYWENSTTKKSFLNLAMDDNGIIQEVLPQKYVYEEPSPFSFLYFSKVIYYFDNRTGMGEKINGLFTKTSYFKNGVEEQIIRDVDRIKAYRHIINEYNKIAKTDFCEEIPVFFLKFPSSIPSFNYDYEEHQSFFKEKETLFEKLLLANHIKVIDLQKAFMEDYKMHSQNFDFENDYHYNKQAHKVIGLELSGLIKDTIESEVNKQSVPQP
jgi:hypothetical protein